MGDFLSRSDITFIIPLSVKSSIIWIILEFWVHFSRNVLSASLIQNTIDAAYLTVKGKLERGPFTAQVHTSFIS